MPKAGFEPTTECDLLRVFKIESCLYAHNHSVGDILANFDLTLIIKGSLTGLLA